MATKEIITRRQLPHWYVPGASHFITYRLFGSLPQHALDQIFAKKQELLSGTSANKKLRAHKQLFAFYDEILHQQRGEQTLTDPRIAAVIRSNLRHHHGAKYYLQAYCVMTNHVHVLLQPKDGDAGANAEMLEIGETDDARNPLSEIMHSIKSYTAHEANKILRRSGTFWQSESYDHWVRDDDELQRIVDYIAANPVKANLVKNPHEWFFSSSHDRYLTDGERSGWLRWD